jgi:pSer/pThr/pTyr-binding forkhead associated (FHA) protein
MAELILKFKDLVLKEVSLEPGSITIGREPDNDIVVENLLVSAYHARIDRTGREYVLTDLHSKNGTFVNGHRVTSTRLKNGDEILVGKHTVQFKLEPTETGGEQRGEVTVFMETPQSVEEPQQPPSETPGGTSVFTERLAVLTFLTGSSADHELAKKLVKLGKGDEADINVGGLLTPKVAATISRRPTGYHLTPTGRSKVKVNGTPLKGSYRLKEFDTIEVGSVRLQFYYKS